MTQDEKFLKAMHIRPDDDISTALPKRDEKEPAQIEIEEEQIEIMAVALENGLVALREESFFRLVDANRSMRQVSIELRKAAENWIEQARENEKKAQQWRGAFYGVLAVMVSGSALVIWSQM